MKKFGARILSIFGVVLALSGLVFAIPYLLGCYLYDLADRILGYSIRGTYQQCESSLPLELIPVEPTDEESDAAVGVSDEIKEKIQLASARIDELVKTEKAYKVLRTGHAEMSERLDRAWHAVCGSGVAAPDALARLLEIIDGQHGDADPHMAAIDVLRIKVDK